MESQTNKTVQPAGVEERKIPSASAQENDVSFNPFFEDAPIFNPSRTRFAARGSILYDLTMGADRREYAQAISVPANPRDMDTQSCGAD